jgi:hypothetical protein
MISNRIFCLLDGLISLYIGRQISFLLIMMVTQWLYFIIFHLFYLSPHDHFMAVLLSSSTTTPRKEYFIICCLFYSGTYYYLLLLIVSQSHDGLLVSALLSRRILMPSLFNHFTVTIWAYSTIHLSFTEKILLSFFVDCLIPYYID